MDIQRIHYALVTFIIGFLWKQNILINSGVSRGRNARPGGLDAETKESLCVLIRFRTFDDRFCSGRNNARRRGVSIKTAECGVVGEGQNKPYFKKKKINQRPSRADERERERARGRCGRTAARASRFHSE